ncbi:MAG TPA: hypothetical protein PK819_00865 [Thermomicrobiales bacterium]|nr:hypothetical protein [Thermomicrobiales bacterium]
MTPESIELTPVSTPHPGLRHFRWMRLVSFGLFLLGITLIVVGETTSVGSTVTLTGGMLVIAGFVKVIIMRLWDGFFAEEFAHQYPERKERS